MGRVLGIVTRAISTHLVQQARFTRREAPTGAITLAQRFSSALNLNRHLTCMDALMPRAHGCARAAHMLFLEGSMCRMVSATTASATRHRRQLNNYTACCM